MNNIKITKDHYIGLLAILLASFLWGIDGGFLREKLSGVPIVLSVFITNFFAFIILSPFIFSAKKRIKTLTTKDWISVLWISVFGGVVAIIMLTKAYFEALNDEVMLENIVAIQRLGPILALILAYWLLKERLSAKFYAWSVVVIFSACVVTHGSLTAFFQGINLNSKIALFAILAAFASGSATVFGKRIVNHLDFKLVAGLRFGFASLVALFLIIINDEIWHFTQLQISQWGYLALISLTSGVISFLFFYYALKKLPASSVIIFELSWVLLAFGFNFFSHGYIANNLQIFFTILIVVAFYFILKNSDNTNYRKFKALVIPSAGTGKYIGLATASLNRISLDIDHGIYTVSTKVQGKSYKGLLHFGNRTTFNLGPSLELYLEDFVGNLYGETVEVETIKKIREVKKFDNPDELREQIRRDLQKIK